MTNIVLTKRRKATEVVLKRACAALPTPAVSVRKQFEALIARFHEYTARSELGLAFGELCAAAELVNCRGTWSARPS